MLGIILPFSHKVVRPQSISVLRVKITKHCSALTYEHIYILIDKSIRLFHFIFLEVNISSIFFFIKFFALVSFG